jgi:hypothetical protein
MIPTVHRRRHLSIAERVFIPRTELSRAARSKTSVSACMETLFRASHDQDVTDRTSRGADCSRIHFSYTSRKRRSRKISPSIARVLRDLIFVPRTR